MRSIKKEIRNLYILFSICIVFFVLINIIGTSITTQRYNKLLKEYERMNEIVLKNNESKHIFRLYNKEHDESVLDQYYKSSDQTLSLLDALHDVMQKDRNCKMMYRIVYQMIENKNKKVESYLDPEIITDIGLINYINESYDSIDRHLNLLMSYYLKYANVIFEQESIRLKKLNMIINLILLIGVSIYFFVNTNIYKNILKSISKLSTAAQEMKNQNFTASDIEITNYIEMNFVIKTFNEMKWTISNLIDEINKNHQIEQQLAEQVLENEQQKRRLVESKMKELQMQMNPHFLFNTLSIIIRSIQLDNKETSILLIKSISKILRSTLKIKSTSIPLDDEIELLQAYLYIQQIHFKGRITFRLDIRKSYMNEDLLVPPLILEPLVENSIQHGLKDVLEGGEIDILIIEKQNCIEVTVRDNGTGISKETIDNIINKQLKNSIGLSNVIERLKLFYKREDVIKIESQKGSMTQITLWLYKKVG